MDAVDSWKMVFIEVPITAFTTATDAMAASQALLDQVLLGDYASGGTKIVNGCTFAGACSVNTGYASSTVLVGRGITYQVTSFYGADIKTGIQFNTGKSLFDNMSSAPGRTIAKWTVSAPVATAVSAVPVPAAAWLFATGLPVVGVFSRRRNQTKTLA